MSTPQNLYSQSAGQVSSADFIAVIEHRDPTSADSHYPVGKRWINSTGNSEWTLTSKSTIGGVITANWETTTGTGGGTSPISKYIVDADGSADYTTVAAAIAAASAAGTPATVYVRPGTYTENLTLVSTICIAGAIDDNTTIIGQHTPPTSGYFSFENITLESATNIIFSAAAGSASLSFEDCILNCANGWAFNVLNWTGSLSIFDCGFIGAADGAVRNTGGSAVTANSSDFGSGTANPFTISGATNIRDIELRCAGTFQGTGEIDIASCVFLGTLTTAGSCQLYMANSVIQTGATPSFTHGSSGVLELDEVVINSTNNPVISGSGAGVISLGTVDFSNGKNIASTLTVVYDASVGRISPYVVGSSGNFATIQAAITAAAGTGATIYVQHGTYTENLTLSTGLTIVGSVDGNTTITGVHTPPATGSFQFQNINLTGSTAIYSSAVAGSASLSLEDCIVSVTNGWAFDVLNWTGALSVFDCAFIGAADGCIRNTGGSTVTANSTDFASGTANPFTISGATNIRDIELRCAGTFQGSGDIDIASCVFLGTLTTAGSCAMYMANSVIQTGATPAFTHGSSGVMELDQVVINSTNNPVISGAGTGILSLGTIDFSNGKNIAATLTVAYDSVIGRISPYVVGTSGNFATIQAAVTACAAGGGGTVYVQAGSYTESLTLSSGVYIAGSIDGNTTITGVHTPPASGTFQFQNITLASATHIFSSAVAGTCAITIEDCYITITNGFVFNLTNWTGALSMFDTGNASTNDGFVTNTGGSAIYVVSSDVGAGTGQTMVVSGATNLEQCTLFCPMNPQTGSSLTIIASEFKSTLTMSNNSSAVITGSRFTTGATASLTQSSSGTVAVSNCTINSTANPVISGSGAGVVTLSGVSFLGISTVASTVTVGGSNATSGGILETGALIQTFPNTYLTFKSSPLLTTAANTAGVATGATGATNLMHLQNGDIMEQFILGAGQTIIGPRMTTTGLLTSLDLTNTEGAEYNFGVNATNKHAYTIGTSPAFFIELSVNAADVGGLDPFVVGFRKQQANSATFTDYTDFATIGARATTAADVVVLQTDLNNAGEVITNTTDAWTDGQTKVFRVNVSSAGVVTYTINGAAPTVTAAFTFDSTDVVMPFIRHTFGAATPAAINWISLKIGYQ